MQINVVNAGRGRGCRCCWCSRALMPSARRWNLPHRSVAMTSTWRAQLTLRCSRSSHDNMTSSS